MIIPSSTYRVQLHKDFTFKDLEAIIDYLHELGITAIYAAPIFKATPGSLHGYDVLDPHTINPEIGTLDDLRRIASRLQAMEMSWIQDIVPNHMAFNTGNTRLMDVLERGRHSPYSEYFDINWDHQSSHLRGKLQVPFLGKPLDECVEAGEISISFSEKGFTVEYFETSYPLAVSAYSAVFGDVSQVSGMDEVVTAACSGIPLHEWCLLRDHFVLTLLTDETLHFDILKRIEELNADKRKVKEILEAQPYVLSFWKETEREMGYRRFFTVNELICLRMEDAFVFDEYHLLLHAMYKEGLIQGVRIDHIDGLKNPSRYVSRLRRLMGEDCYIIAEKILEAKEDIPEHWPLQGTSGYEFLSYVSQLITDRKGAKALVSFYRSLVPDLPPYRELVLKNKQLILEQYMAGEWDNLVEYFFRLGLASDFKRDRLRKSLATFMTSLPVYRIYPSKLPLAGDDLHTINETFTKAIARAADVKYELEYLKGLFTGSHPDMNMEATLCFLQRLMQFTGPLTAKGVEDTTFYMYNALISHDEVGDAPSTLGISIASYHEKMKERQRTTPYSLNATATHDTKRGEDARLRLNALCEYPDEWQKIITALLEKNRSLHRRLSSGQLAPVVNDEYAIYQAILGGFPDDLNVTGEWIERLLAYQTKAVREAKINSDWANPDSEYETACHSFIRGILGNDSEFIRTFVPLAEKIIERSNILSVVQSVLKIASPGIPDIYQGCELWDLSFVDPDNRRPVDYGKRMTMLEQVRNKARNGKTELMDFLAANHREGALKLFATWMALQFRRSNPSIFTEGSYIPLQLTEAERVTICFARKLESRWVIVIAPLETKLLSDAGQPAVAGGAEVVLPDQSPDSWRDVFTGLTIQTNGRIRIADCLRDFPVAMLTNVE